MNENKRLYIYGIADGTMALIPTIYNSYWSLFLSSAAGLSTAGMATVMSIIGIADVISIVLVAFLIQKANLKFGKFRFWVLLGGILAAVTRVLAFSTAAAGSVAYYSVMIVISSSMYNLAYCAYMGMIPIISDTQEGRMKAVTAQQQAVAIFAILCSLVGVSIVNSGSNGYALLSAISAVFIIVSVIPMYIVTKPIDKYVPTAQLDESKKVSTFEMLRLVINLPMFIYLIGSVCKIVGSIGLTMLASYYYTYTYGDMSMLTVYLTASTVLQLIGASLAPYVAKAVKGSRNAFACGLFIYSACLAVAYVGGKSSAFLFTAMLAVGYLGWAVSHTADGAYYSNIGDYVEFYHHKNIQPFLMSLISLVIKIGVAVTSVIIGWGLVAVGFDASNVTEEAKVGITNLTVLMPLAIMLIGGIVTMLSPLSDKKIMEIQTELQRRHASNEE